jgi:hypothetical protein
LGTGFSRASIKPFARRCLTRGETFVNTSADDSCCLNSID